MRKDILTLLVELDAADAPDEGRSGLVAFIFRIYGVKSDIPDT